MNIFLSQQLIIKNTTQWLASRLKFFQRWPLLATAGIGPLKLLKNIYSVLKASVLKMELGELSGSIGMIFMQRRIEFCLLLVHRNPVCGTASTKISVVSYYI